MQGWVSVTQQLNAVAPDVLLSDRGHRPYTAADLDQPDARLLVRDYADAERHEIDRAAWHFARVEDGRMVPDATHVALDGGFEPGRFYEIIFRTDMSPIVGAGMLAFRDAASFLRYSTADDNPAGAIDATADAGDEQLSVETDEALDLSDLDITEAGE